MRTLKIDNFRKWLADFIPFAATSREVSTFNGLFKAIHTRRKAKTHTVQATRIKVAFSFDALRNC